MTERKAASLISLVCVLLAILCVGLAAAYGRKVAELRCISDFTDMDLSPPPGHCP